jgi:hypothetical protein
MEEVVQRGDAKAALKRVRQNKGSPGVDGMTVDEQPPTRQAQVAHPGRPGTSPGTSGELSR